MGMVTIVRLIERISGVIGFIGAWVMLPLIVSMVYEVFARKFSMLLLFGRMRLVI